MCVWPVKSYIIRYDYQGDNIFHQVAGIIKANYVSAVVRGADSLSWTLQKNPQNPEGQMGRKVSAYMGRLIQKYKGLHK